MIPMTLASISESDMISDDPMKFCRALNFLKQPSADRCKIGALQILAIFTGKHLP